MSVGGLLALGALLAQGWVEGQGRSAAKIKADVKATKVAADGTQELTVTIDIDKGWYIYANPVGNPNFDGAETTLRIVTKEKIKLEVAYPAGKVKRDDLGAYKIYEGQVAVTAKLQRAKADTGPLEVHLEVNACDKSQCLPRGTLKLAVP
jgi:DsbC/DsbD-like thiol-disulfide interchange protein